MEAERQKSNLFAPSRTTPRVRQLFGGIFDYEVKAERLHVVNAELEDPNCLERPKTCSRAWAREKKI